MAQMDVLERQLLKEEAQGTPAVLYAASALPLLTPQAQAVLDKMLPVIQREAGAGRGVEVYGTAPAEEIEAQLVVSVKTDLPAEEAFALWDSVGDAVQEWTAALPPPQQDTALGIAVEVLWNVDHAA